MNTPSKIIATTLAITTMFAINFDVQAQSSNDNTEYNVLCDGPLVSTSHRALKNPLSIKHSIRKPTYSANRTLKRALCELSSLKDDSNENASDK